MDGDATDRYWDELILVARDYQMMSAGFIGIGLEGVAWFLIFVIVVHRPSNVLVGIEE